jgi:hypothetical protein
VVVDGGGAVVVGAVVGATDVVDVVDVVAGVAGTVVLESVGAGMVVGPEAPLSLHAAAARRAASVTRASRRCTDTTSSVARHLYSTRGSLCAVGWSVEMPTRVGGESDLQQVNVRVRSVEHSPDGLGEPVLERPQFTGVG